MHYIHILQYCNYNNNVSSAQGNFGSCLLIYTSFDSVYSSFKSKLFKFYAQIILNL